MRLMDPDQTLIRRLTDPDQSLSERVPCFMQTPCNHGLHADSDRVRVRPGQLPLPPPTLGGAGASGAQEIVAVVRPHPARSLPSSAVLL